MLLLHVMMTNESKIANVKERRDAALLQTFQEKCFLQISNFVETKLFVDALPLNILWS